MAVKNPQRILGQSGWHEMERSPIQKEKKKKKKRKKGKNSGQIDQYRNSGPSPKLQPVIGKNWKYEPDLNSILFSATLHSFSYNIGIDVYDFKSASLKTILQKYLMRSMPNI